MLSNQIPEAIYCRGYTALSLSLSLSLSLGASPPLSLYLTIYVNIAIAIATTTPITSLGLYCILPRDRYIVQGS